VEQPRCGATEPQLAGTCRKDRPLKRGDADHQFFCPEEARLQVPLTGSVSPSWLLQCSRSAAHLCAPLLWPPRLVFLRGLDDVASSMEFRRPSRQVTGHRSQIPVKSRLISKYSPLPVEPPFECNSSPLIQSHALAKEEKKCRRAA
jgi:hypothetical protein